MDTISVLDPLERGFTAGYRRGSRSPTPSADQLEKRALLLQNDLLLHEAVIKNDADAVKAILAEPHNINSRNNYGRAPIHWAASRGSTDIMNMLIEANCDIEARDKYGMKAILMAAWHGHRDAVEALVTAGAQTDVVNKKMFTLLICGSHNNRVSVVSYLLERVADVDVDATDVEGQTALYHAALGGHTTVLRRLVRASAHPAKRNKEGRTALHAACEHGHEEVARYLLGGEVEGVDMEAADVNGDGPLHTAARHQQTGLVRLLLEHGADPDKENELGCTPLHVATSQGCRGITDELLTHGAHINKQTKDGSTPLHLACLANETDTVELLIANGADLNCLNNRLQSPMHIAAELGHSEACRALLGAGANLEQRERGGKTPLYVAALGSFTAIVDMIIKTARLDFPTQEEPRADAKRKSSLSLLARSRVRRSVGAEPDVLQATVHKLAYKQLGPGEWKRLAYHWTFTDDQIQAIEHQYTGPASYKEHGYRMFQIWVYGLEQGASPVRELCDALVAIDRKSVADTLRKKVEQETKAKQKGSNKRCVSCTIT